MFRTVSLSSSGV